DQLLDQALLVFRVHDLEALDQAGFAPVQPQQPVRKAVEGADPERAPGDAQQRLDPPPHLSGRLVRERHRQNTVRRDLLGLDQPGDSMREHPRLAASRTGQHQHRGERGRDRLALRLVEGIQKGGQVHGGRIVPCAPGPVQRAGPFAPATSSAFFRASAASSRAPPASACRRPVTTSSAKRTRATTNPSSTGPMTRPRMPKADAPPMAPMNTARVETSARWEVRNGRRKLSATPTPALQTARKIAAPQRPPTIKYSTAGTSTMAEPAGRKAAMVASTANTTGEGRPTMAKPTPASTPCMSAVATEPNTTASVTLAR